MTVPFYLLGNDSAAARDCSLIWAFPCLLLSSRSQKQGACFPQTNAPTACFLLLLEAELSKTFRKTWSYLQKAWEQETCFPRAFWLAIHWCGWRPPPSSQQFPIKVKHPMLKVRKKKNPTWKFKATSKYYLVLFHTAPINYRSLYGLF